MDLKGAVLVVEVGGAELRPLSPLLLQILAPPRALYVITRSLTSSWRPFGPLDFVLRALRVDKVLVSAADAETSAATP